ncbi:ABC transporter ATP-binding protein [Brevibacillus ginsengisoli]|uniref:ABC transporter ATP-binding protein n=1 Tax=Brevibacillus ginsengisoli TaxID=363854 RepID=UPI003CF46AA8
MIPAIEASNLQLRRGKKEVFSIDHFTLKEGEVAALVGPNGTGKTSLILTLALLQRPSCGQIFHYGTPAGKNNLLSLRRQMAVVFQEPLLMDTTVLGNVITGLRIRGMARTQAEALGREWLKRLGIADLEQRSALQLSGGEAQRVNLARALALEPRILFLDEPFSALDYPTRSMLLEDLNQILKETGMTALFVTHDYTEIPVLASRVVVMLEGKLIRDGDVDQVLGRTAVRPRVPAPWE